MDTYVTGTIIAELRQKLGLTQKELADRISVSDKTISKWERSKGLPDITLIEPLARALGVSVPELMNGEQIINKNRSGSLLRGKFYVCPICGNVIYALGETMISCCGIPLPPQDAEDADESHEIVVENVEDEYYITIKHPMEKEHYISFIAFVSGDRCDIRKLYPEGNAECRLSLRGRGFLYAYCNRHGLFKIRA